MINNEILKKIYDVVTNDLIEPCTLIHSKFFIDAEGNQKFLPIKEIESKYPVLLTDTINITLAPDLRNVTYNMIMDYLVPGSEDLSDVPEIHEKANNIINTIIFALINDRKGYQLKSGVVMTPVMRMGKELLAGYRCIFTIATQNNFSNCCK